MFYSVTLKMSRTVEVVIGSPVHLDQPSGSSPVYVTETKPGDPPGVRGFLKINPDALGVKFTSHWFNVSVVFCVETEGFSFSVFQWLEILTGAVVFGLVFWNYESWLLLPACFVSLLSDVQMMFCRRSFVRLSCVCLCS